MSRSSTSESPPPSEEQGGVEVVVKFSDNSIEDLLLEKRADTYVSELRKEIRTKVGGTLSNRRLRLIHNGRLLNNNETLAGLQGVVNGKRFYVHCSIGTILTPAEMAEEARLENVGETGGSSRQVPPRQSVRSTLPEVRGFDMLRSQGFSETEINNMRAQFYETSGVQNDVELEEQWINNDLNIMDYHYVNDLLALLMGMFVGVACILALRETSVFSPRQRRYVLGGILINFLFALVRLFN